MNYLKSSPRKITTSYSFEFVHEVHSNTSTARLPISKKTDVGFLGELDTYKSMV